MRAEVGEGAAAGLVAAGQHARKRIHRQRLAPRPRCDRKGVASRPGRVGGAPRAPAGRARGSRKAAAAATGVQGDLEGLAALGPSEQDESRARSRRRSRSNRTLELRAAVVIRIGDDRPVAQVESERARAAMLQGPQVVERGALGRRVFRRQQRARGCVVTRLAERIDRELTFVDQPKGQGAKRADVGVDRVGRQRPHRPRPQRTLQGIGISAPHAVDLRPGAQVLDIARPGSGTSSALDRRRDAAGPRASSGSGRSRRHACAGSPAPRRVRRPSRTRRSRRRDFGLGGRRSASRRSAGNLLLARPELVVAIPSWRSVVNSDEHRWASSWSCRS